MCYDTGNKRADRMANHDRDDGSFYISLNKSKLFWKNAYYYACL